MRRSVSKISGIFIPVTDMQRSKEWYIRMFDLETIDLSDCCTGLAFPGEATFINLWKVERPVPTQFDAGGGMRIPYYNFESFDIEYSHALFVRKGRKYCRLCMMRAGPVSLIALIRTATSSA